MLFEYTDKYSFFDIFSMFVHVNRINDLPVLGEDECKMGYISPLFHEITHFECLNTDFGINVVSGIYWLIEQYNRFDENEFVKFESGEIFVDPWGKKKKIRDMMIAKFLPDIGCALPVLEGIAMYQQLDFLCSEKCNISTSHWWLNTFLNPPKEKNINIESYKTYINKLFQDIHSFNLKEKQLFYKLHFCVNRENSYYLTGYIYIKTLAEILKRKDSRFEDTELCYIFLRNYLFNGSDLREIEELSPGWFLMSYQKRFELLEVVDNRIVSAIVDLILNFGDGYNMIDIYGILNNEDKLLKPMMVETLLTQCKKFEIENVGEVLNFFRASQFINIKLSYFKLAFLEIENKENIDNKFFRIVLVSPHDGVLVNSFLPKSKAKELHKIIKNSHKTTVNFNTDIFTIEKIRQEVLNNPDRFLAMKQMLSVDCETKIPTSILFCNDFVYATIESQKYEFNPNKERLERDIEIVEKYLSFYHRYKITDFLISRYKNKMPFVGGMIMDFNLFVYAHMMNFQGGGKLESFINNGFSLIGVDQSDQLKFGLDYDPILKAKNPLTIKMNSILKYHIY